MKNNENKKSPTQRIWVSGPVGAVCNTQVADGLHMFGIQVGFLDFGVFVKATNKDERLARSAVYKASRKAARATKDSEKEAKEEQEG